MRDAKRRAFEKLYADVAVLAYCVLDNHFHLIVHQFAADGMARLMRRTLASYAKHHNTKHGWSGPIFNARYAAKPMGDPDHLKEMLGYTILNDPIEQLSYKYCSNDVMLGERRIDWLRDDLALGVFGGVDGYRDYMNRTGPRRVASKLKRWGIDPQLHPYRPI
ncbi:MAG: hypothetical protein QM648_12290 [Solirubrobacterales bacterium]